MVSWKSISGSRMESITLYVRRLQIDPNERDMAPVRMREVVPLNFQIIKEKNQNKKVDHTFWSKDVKGNREQYKMLKQNETDISQNDDS